MGTSQKFDVEEFLHYQLDYNPAKAREYYLRTRKLKGRQPGSTKPVSTRTSTARSPTLKKPLTKAQQEQKRKATKGRIADLTARLEKLRAILRELVKQAKLRSGVDSEEEATKKEKEKAAGSGKLTVAEKKEQAEYSKEYREKHKPKTLDDKEKQLQEQIKAINEKIVEARQKLAEARAK